MLGKKIGIDLGTSTVLIYVKGEGIVVNEPSLVAVNRDGSRILAIGRQAQEMLALCMVVCGVLQRTSAG